MSGQPTGGIAAIPAWVRYGAIAGVFAFGCTLSANMAITWFKPADLCRTGPLIIPLLMLAALVVFLMLAGAAGFATGRASGSGPAPLLAGLLVGVFGGCALLALIPFAPSVGQRIQDLMALCPGAGGSFSFDLGPTPPSAVVLATPPPGFFTTSPPPGAITGPPTGVAALVSAVTPIAIGMGLAAGAAALAGLLGVATRSDARSDRPH
ncbi:MAG TPA: hypothetical protein VN973_01585 [Candidatus Dormibacteraeota bacterium]|nr:hypothetical protein [Candidatus Dormibacteraeota bacterium]